MRTRHVIVVLVTLLGTAPAAAEEEVEYTGFVEHLIVPGTDFTDVVGMAAGTQSDGLGTAIAGSTSLENHYVVDGVDVTGLEYGNAGSPVVVDFIEELEIITGGYDAELGGASGGQIRVTTKSGRNQLRGSVFAYYLPGFLAADAERAPSLATSIDARTDRDYSVVLGAEVGGPIVEDHAWYWIGFAPQRSASTVTRTTRNQTAILDERELPVGTQAYAILAKLDGAIDPSHQGGLSLQVTPESETSVNTQGWVDQQRFASRTVTTDVAASWTSKLHGDLTVVKALVGMHRRSDRFGSRGGERDDVPLQTLSFDDGSWAELGGESEATRLGCADGGCPMNSYSIGGPGALRDDVERRLSAQLSATRRLRGHAIEGGIDIEDDRLQKARLYSGDRVLRSSFNVTSTSWVALRPAGEAGTYPCSQGASFHGCEILGADDPESYAHYETIGWAAYLKDSWMPRSNLTLNFGVRYEEQHLRDALTVRDMWAPRLGVIFDPTDEGRSKIFGHWGRYYQPLLMHLHDRSFNRGVSLEETFDLDECSPDGTCAHTDPEPPLAFAYGGSNADVAPDLGGQYLDEGLAGVEYALTEDLLLGAFYQQQRLGRVVEDVSLDGAVTYQLANPGEGTATAFERPRRDHDALQVYVTRRFADGLYVQASYRYARTEGNYPGLYSPDNGQVDPNVSSQYDMIELGANRDGPLPQDRPHYVKLDGYYTFDLEREGDLTIGLRGRARSGTPINAMASHSRYGTGESFLLPRGSLGRTPFETSLDLHADYRYKLSRGVYVSVFVDVFNVANDQGTFAVDSSYTFPSSANPIVGGSYEDLIWAKERSITGAETSLPVRRNQNFRNITSRYAPLSARFGARLSF